MGIFTKTRRYILLGAVFALIAGTVVVLVLTQSEAPQSKSEPAHLAPLVDEQPVQTARTMAGLVSGREEQRFAQQALRLADHAVDLAFADAMREATLHPPVPTAENKEVFARVKRAEAQVKSDHELIEMISKASGDKTSANKDLQVQIDLLQAQLELDKDELEDAKGDLLRSGADPLSRIQRQFARYQAAQQKNDAASMFSRDPQTASESANNLIAQVQAWHARRGKVLQLQRARNEAANKREQLQQKHDEGEEADTPQPEQEKQEAGSGEGSADRAVLALLRRMSERQKNLIDLDSRIRDHQDLATVYGNWAAFAQEQQRSIVRGMLRSVLLILLIILVVYLAQIAMERMFSEWVPDQRRIRTLRVILRFALQAGGVLLVLLVVFGAPSQISTIVGLAGAGLTVALKDFIVAFIGWFALMGRNGIRVGDWVEIQGVVGEVAEIGLFRTVLLETGNWNDAGHPTGRKVAFMNSFAIEGHFFNFSTSGQWLWDELQILVPADQNPYLLYDAIQKLVSNATEKDARQAEEEWQRATQREHVNAVSAGPAINLRPTSSGTEVHVRYITRAYERYATRTRLYQDVVELLHRKDSGAA